MEPDLSTLEATTEEPAVLLVNAESRSGRGVFDQIHAELKAAGVPLLHEVEVTRSAALPRFIQAAIEGGARRLIIGGGDGSLSCAADRILANGADVALGVIPLGTGNDFARSIGMPLQFRRAISALRSARPWAIDVGMVNGRAFLNAASVGVTTAIARALTLKAKRRLGAFAYPFTAIRAGLKQEPFQLHIERPNEGTLELRALELVIGNGPFHGGGLRVSPLATLNDSLLDAYVILTRGTGGKLTPARAISLLKVGARLNLGEHITSKDVLQFRTAALDVTTDPPQQANVDGELVDAERLHCEVRPRALRVLAPARHQPR